MVPIFVYVVQFFSPRINILYLYIWSQFWHAKKGNLNDWMSPGRWSMRSPWEVTESLINGGMEGWTMEKLVPDGLEAIWGFPKMVGLPNNHGFSY